MPQNRLIPVQLNVIATSAPNLTVDTDNEMDVYIGEGIEFDATLVHGGPPVTEAQWRNAELQLFTDSGRNNAFANDGDVTHEFRDIDVSAGTAKLYIEIDSDVTAQTFYAYLRVEQGI